MVKAVAAGKMRARMNAYHWVLVGSENLRGLLDKQRTGRVKRGQIMHYLYVSIVQSLQHKMLVSGGRPAPQERSLCLVFGCE